MKSIKYLLIILVSLTLLGCTKSNIPEDIKNKALEYLNSNYSDTFTPQVYASINWAYDYSTVTFSSEKYPEAVVEVEVYKDDDEIYVMR